METASAQGATQNISFTFPHVGDVGTGDEDVEEMGNTMKYKSSFENWYTYSSVHKPLPDFTCETDQNGEIDAAPLAGVLLVEIAAVGPSVRWFVAFGRHCRDRAKVRVER
jgi:hypothetical protein